MCAYKSSILVADDDALFLEVASRIFKHYDITTVGASDGETAVSFAIDLLPDVILMDINMPKMGGVEACSKLKQHPDPAVRAISILMISAEFDAATLDEAFNAGAEDYLLKPLNWAILARRVQALVAKRRQAPLQHSMDPVTSFSGKASAIPQTRNGLLVPRAMLTDLCFS